MKIILASASPRRKDLLNMIGLNFEIEASNIDEVIDESLTIPKQVEKIAEEKTFSIANKYKGQNYLIIGSDTVVEISGKVLGKPNNKEESYQMIKSLSGNEHNVITAISIIPTNDFSKKITNHKITKVKFRNLSEHEINGYVETNEGMDKAGSYALQGIGAVLVEKIDGCYSNVIGLPVPLLTEILEENFSLSIF